MASLFVGRVLVFRHTCLNGSFHFIFQYPNITPRFHECNLNIPLMLLPTACLTTKAERSRIAAFPHLTTVQNAAETS